MDMMRHKFFLILLCSFIELSLFALPAKKGIITVNQPDGTQLRIEGHGDENFHYITTEDGFLVRKNTEGVYEYAEFSEQEIQPLGIKARSLDERPDAEKMFLSKMPKNAITISPSQEMSMRKMAMQEQSSISQQRIIGSRNCAPRGLIILVNFKDKSFSPENTLAEMDSMLNGVNYTYDGATGSARKYFLDQSSGTYNPTFDVVGPVNLSNNIDFYGSNDSRGNDLRPDSMVIEACYLADKELDVDFSQYDTDNDGVVDFVFVIYAGYGESSNYSDSPNLIWQHAWYIYQGAGKRRIIDGKWLNTYACSCELSGSVGSNKRDGIGAFCHEFSHVLGLPDLYPTNGASHRTLGRWDIMDQGPYNNNSKTPPSYSAYERFFMGWLTPTPLQQTKNNIALGELQSTNQSYLYCADGEHNLNGENPSPSQFYLFENRQKVGWDAYLPGHGLLLTKINYNSSSWTYNTVNNNSANMGIDIIEADGKATYGDTGDTYPGSTSCQEFSIGEYIFSSITESKYSIIYFKFYSEKDTALPDVFKEEEKKEEENILVLSSKEMLQLKNLPEKSAISVYNLFGELVFSAENLFSETSLHLKQGIYLIQVKSPQKKQLIKVLVK